MNTERDICSICLDDYKAPVSLSCKHYFCGKCINNLVNKNVEFIYNKPCISTSTCPLCRKEFNTDKLYADPFLCRMMDPNYVDFKRNFGTNNRGIKTITIEEKLKALGFITGEEDSDPICSIL